MQTFNKGYGFDTFEGLPEDWHKQKAGTYSSDGHIQEFRGGEFIVENLRIHCQLFAEQRPKLHNKF